MEHIENNVEIVDSQQTNDKRKDNAENHELQLLDCGTWPDLLDDGTVDHIIKIGPMQSIKDIYPRNQEGRHFSQSYFKRKLPNGEVFPRQWLVYSNSKDSVFCFCCRIFEIKSSSKLVCDGYKNWKHLSEIIGIHENGVAHMGCYQRWKEMEMRMRSGKTIDMEEQKLIEKESLRWQHVLYRLMNIILYLSSHNMAFRGSSDKLCTRNNGNFLGLVQLLAKFDPVMENHVTMATKGEISDHYCGKNIQNELISLMANEVNKIIISRALIAKYYAIIADCTPDISHIEQLSLTIRFVDLSGNKIEMKEHFLGFIPVYDSTGAGLTDVLLEMLKQRGLNINNCRGQGYDNGFNMKGKHNGVQKKILTKTF